MMRSIAILIDEEMDGEFPLTLSLKGAGCVIAESPEEDKILMVTVTPSPELAKAILGFCWCHPAVKMMSVSLVTQQAQVE